MPMHTDPVCHMQVDQNTAAAVSEYQGRRYKSLSAIARELGETGVSHVPRPSSAACPSPPASWAACSRPSAWHGPLTRWRWRPLRASTCSTNIATS